MSRNIVFYLHVHQPSRVQPYSVFDTGWRHDYFSQHDPNGRTNNETIFRKVAQKSYWPMTHMLVELLDQYPQFVCNLSITGTFIEQCEQWDPALLQQFQRLVATGRVEIIAETYYHSLAFFYSRFEFEKQVLMHREKIQQVFGVTPHVFRNTELSYNDELGAWAESAGYKGILAEGWDPILGYRSPNYVYRPKDTQHAKLLLKNYRLSDDMAFRFSNREWKEWPLTAEKYKAWIDATPEEPVINLFMDFETFGEHQWEDTGIFDFFETFVRYWLSDPRNAFLTASSACERFESVDEVSMPQTVTWADSERDLSAWTGNRMQTEALGYVYAMENDIVRSGDNALITSWRHLQTSDHFYYMCTKWFTDGDVHAYFSPYESPYDAFLYYLNVMRDVHYRINEHRKAVL
ncbi:alpha-amylase [Candidatus Saccharibacteria bacterium]|nr:MAG: alpha-amylase [Candidatus Saccharibacteria bacterium]